jgi:class 3 adenylate cyclase/tetratricopeptide (TPR) repeat protein
MAALQEWLKQHGLEALTAVLAENDIDLDILPDLTDLDLEQLGLSLGQRRRLLKAVATLAADPAPVARRASPTAQVASVPDGPAAPREAERRQVTVMFCDLVGSTELSGQLDPEEMSTLIRGYQDACAGAIARYDGFLAKLMGDGVLAYFGFPHAHEDSAERAVRAALAVVDIMPLLAAPDGRRLQARIGIATGLVVVGDIVGTGVAREQSIVGETPNLAARLQAFAAPDTVLVSESTHRLIGRVFDVESVGDQVIKGFPRPVPVWRVRGESAIASRFAAVRPASRVPFIGREHEIGLLLDRWRLAKSGEGQFVLLTGEAGIGKSRLVEALRQHGGDEPKIVLGLQGSSHHLNTALYPLVRHLELAAGFAIDDPPAQKLDKLEALLAQAGTASGAVVPLFSDLMSLQADGRFAPLDLSPAQRRAAVIAAFVDYLTRRAEQAPILFLVEDAHWIDPTTVELITQLIDAVSAARVLAIVTARPDFASPWTGRAHATPLALSRLDRAQCAEIVAGIAAAQAIPRVVLDEILAKTDGVPLFVEEVTKSILESGPTDGAAVPATLQDSLMARLDRLGGAKEIAQIAAVIGRQFSHALLAAVAPASAADLDDAITNLVQSEIVFPQHQALEASYSFKHALMRDAAYDSLLRARRRTLHERIGKALEARFPAVAAEEPEQLAHHFGTAGLADAAARYHERAGDRAVARSAYNEAVAHFSAALNETRTLPDSARRELALLLKLNPALSILKSALSREFGDASRRAYEIAQGLGDGPELFKATWNLWLGDNLAQRSAPALARAEELVALGERLRDEDLLLEAVHCRWSTAFFRGDHAVAFNDTSDGIRRYDPARHHQLGAAYGGHDPGVCAHAVHGVTLALAGRFAAARASIEAAVALAERLGQPHSLAHAHFEDALASQIAGDRVAVDHASRRLIDIAERYDFPPQQAAGRFLSGWARAAGPDLAVGLDLMEAEFARASVLGPLSNYFGTLLADIRAQSGRVAEAYQLIEQILAAIKGPDIGFYLPQLLGLRQACLARLPPSASGDTSGALATATRLAKRHSDGLAALQEAAALGAGSIPG